MPTEVTAIVNQQEDERVLQIVARALRGNDSYAQQVREFAKSFDEEQRVGGLQFSPKAGHILACNFGLGFKAPEMVKVRPVLVVSPKANAWTGLSVVIPISSKAPEIPRPYHHKLPDGLIPNPKYDEAWLKGDMVIAVGRHRLDRLKVGHRQYATPKVDDATLREARRCVLHAAGMHSLTIHW
ncbi:type II toxin-antitoxin system PemK/MazF family toxin [Croceicoccus sp. BE223]|uniref:type II toxin-antitoxin system PemK/MazF family toxin n=1 Tax=Croceicoccus sp. BE223 TaxID=2817716 RepID=UPI00285C20ED|nr:type II toxin-antitoxin system PemK/MazF family toxin [Croceicoccus sp. BE223]MDR7100925.1 uncharacterized protein YifN (PemK superfamily) [Croceicoccus sp. BE223]